MLAAAPPGPRPGYRTDRVRAGLAARGRWRDEPFDDLTGPDGIDPRHAVHRRWTTLLPAERTVAVDSGNFMGYPAAYLRVPDEHGFCFTQGFQSIGLGLATAIGAALARPDRLAVAALGDGGALMGVAELETVVRAGIPMVVVVYDDRGYGAEVHHFTDADLTTVRFPETDIAAIGRGFGFDAVTVRAPADLAGVASWLAGPRTGPAAGRRQDRLRRRVLVAGRGVPRALVSRCAGDRRRIRAAAGRPAAAAAAGDP